MNTNNERFFEILAGPNKDLLFDACKYAYSKIGKVNITFTVAVGYTRPKDDPTCAYIPMKIADILISGIEHEDGSSESFNITGYCKANLEPSGSKFKPYRFEAYYNTMNREGKISFN